MTRYYNKQIRDTCDLNVILCFQYTPPQFISASWPSEKIHGSLVDILGHVVAANRKLCPWSLANSLYSWRGIYTARRPPTEDRRIQRAPFVLWSCITDNHLRKKLIPQSHSSLTDSDQLCKKNLILLYDIYISWLYDIIIYIIVNI